MMLSTEEDFNTRVAKVILRNDKLFDSGIYENRGTRNENTVLQQNIHMKTASQSIEAQQEI